MRNRALSTRPCRAPNIERNRQMSDPKSIFTSVYQNNAWLADSKSGEGSTLESAKNIIRELPPLLKSLGVKSMLDIPCGDFHWMQAVDLSGVSYLGADIVEPMIVANIERYGTANRRFQVLDMVNGALPRVDLVFTRDCFIHLPNEMILSALRKVVESQSQWFLASSYSWRAHPNNIHVDDIYIGGRRINLEEAPFGLPPPARTIVEGEMMAFCADKSLCLWRVADVADALARSGVYSAA